MYDFIAIGDIVTDDFIDLKDIRIDTEKDEGDQGSDEICLRLGDKVQYESSIAIPAVGNAPNAAVSAKRLGLNASLITDIGDDYRGKVMLEALEKNGIDTHWVKTHKNIESNYHYVLRNGAERTILVKHNEYPYALPKNLEPPKWFYFSSVGEHGLDYHSEIAEFIKSAPSVKLAFQPGTFQISLGPQKLQHIYKACEVFFCNKEEAQKILQTDSDEMMDLLSGIRELGPKISVITDGPKGAYAGNDIETWFMPMYPDPATPIDRTGAGDSFSSTFVSALILGHDIPTALSWGPVNSMSVVQHIGAQEGLVTTEVLEHYLKNAPEDYIPRKIA
jgi:hypothetical protein